MRTLSLLFLLFCFNKSTGQIFTDGGYTLGINVVPLINQTLEFQGSHWNNDAYWGSFWGICVTGGGTLKKINNFSTKNVIINTISGGYLFIGPRLQGVTEAGSGINVGLDVGLSYFKNLVSISIPHHYGKINQDLSKSGLIFGIKIPILFCIGWGKGIITQMGVQYEYFQHRKDDLAFASYYQPGFGFVTVDNNSISDNNGRLNVVFSFVYKIK